MFICSASFLSALGLPFSLDVSLTLLVHLGVSLQDIPNAFSSKPGLRERAALPTEHSAGGEEVAEEQHLPAGT